MNVSSIRAWMWISILSYFFSYAISDSNINDSNFQKLDQEKTPDIVLVKKKSSCWRPAKVISILVMNVARDASIITELYVEKFQPNNQQWHCNNAWVWETIIALERICCCVAVEIKETKKSVNQCFVFFSWFKFNIFIFLLHFVIIYQVFIYLCRIVCIKISIIPDMIFYFYKSNMTKQRRVAGHNNHWQDPRVIIVNCKRNDNHISSIWKKEILRYFSLCHFLTSLSELIKIIE